MRLDSALLLVAALALLGSPGCAKSRNWPNVDCGDIFKLKPIDVDRRVIDKINEKHNIDDYDLSFSKQKCSDGYFIFIEAVGKHRNPGRHWLAVVYNGGDFEIMDGM